MARAALRIRERFSDTAPELRVGSGGYIPLIWRRNRKKPPVTRSCSPWWRGRGGEGAVPTIAHKVGDGPQVSQALRRSSGRYPCRSGPSLLRPPKKKAITIPLRPACRASHSGLQGEAAERCRSGRSGRSRKPLYPRGYRGFESLPLRQIPFHVPPHHPRNPAETLDSGRFGIHSAPPLTTASHGAMMGRMMRR